MSSRMQQNKNTRYGYGTKSRAGVKAYLQKTRAKRLVRPGYTRTSGYYGRYNRPGSSSELKFFDTSINFSIDTTGAIEAQLNLVPQGTTESQRIGRKITIKSIAIKGYIEGNGVASTAQLVQMNLILDKQCNGAAAAYNDVYVSNSINAHRNMANSERFDVLKTWRIPINPQVTIIAGTSFLPTYKNFKYYKKCNIPIEFNNTTGAIAEIRSNNLSLIAISAGGDDTANFTATARITYSD